MLKSSPVRYSALLCCAGVLCLSGCGGPKSGTVKGKVVLPAGLKLEKDDSLQVTLSPVTANAPGGGGAKVDPSDLTFTNKGPEGKGVQAGKYKVSVTFNPYTSDDAAMKRKRDIDTMLAPFSIDKTPLTVDLTGSDQEITID